jgi:ankyrin repeat protein
VSDHNELMSSPRHRRHKNAQREAHLDVLKRGEAWNALSPHEKYLTARTLETWKHLPNLPLAAFFRDAETIKAMIAAGEDLESCATDGVTALMYSARFGEPQAVRALVEAGASVNRQDNERGATPLIHAAENGHTEIVKLLLKSGADPRIQLTSGRTFLHAAVGGGSLEIVHFALDAGIEVNCKSDDGLTPIHVAAWSRSPRLLKLLLDHGADVNAKTTWGMTALIAVTTDDQSFLPAHAECTTLLVEHGADVNVQDSEGSTPLMGAAFYGDLEVVKYLRQRGAKLDIVDGRGRTAMVKAQTSGKLDIASFLTSEECR